MEVVAQEKKGSIVKNQVLECCQITKLTWRIDDFSVLNVKKLFSEIFVFCGFKWRISLYPKGNRVDDYLSLYLDVIDEATAPAGWFIDADVTFYLIDQIDDKKTVDGETKCTFKQWHVSQGFPAFISHDKLHHPGRGYLFDDTCIIEVEVSVSASSSVSMNRADSSVAVHPSISNTLQLDAMDSIYSKAQSFLKSRSKQSFSSISDPSITVADRSSQDTAILVNGDFNELISLPLNELADPNHGSAMREYLFTLGKNSFSEERIQQIQRLKDEFPRIIEDWRESVQVLVDCQSFLSNFEETENLLEEAVKTEEGIKDTLDKLKIRSKELEKELESARKEEKRLAERRREASKKTHEFYVTAQDQNVEVENKKLEMAQARDDIEDLKVEWDSLRSHFI